MTRGQRVFTGAPVVLVPFESKGDAGWHLEGSGRTAASSTDVTGQVRRSDIRNWAIVLRGKQVR